MPSHPKLETLTVERGLIFGLALLLIGFALVGWIVLEWWQTGFGELDYPYTMRRVIPGVTFAALGFQTMLASLMAGVLKMHRKTPPSS